MDLKTRLEQPLRLEFAHEDELARVAESDPAPAADAWVATDHLAQRSLVAAASDPGSDAERPPAPAPPSESK